MANLLNRSNTEAYWEEPNDKGPLSSKALLFLLCLRCSFANNHIPTNEEAGQKGAQDIWNYVDGITGKLPDFATFTAKKIQLWEYTENKNSKVGNFDKLGPSDRAIWNYLQGVAKINKEADSTEPEKILILGKPASGKELSEHSKAISKTWPDAARKMSYSIEAGLFTQDEFNIFHNLMSAELRNIAKHQVAYRTTHAVEDKKEAAAANQRALILYNASVSHLFETNNIFRTMVNKKSEITYQDIVAAFPVADAEIVQHHYDDLEDFLHDLNRQKKFNIPSANLLITRLNENGVSDEDIYKTVSGISPGTIKLKDMPAPIGDTAKELATDAMTLARKMPSFFSDLYQQAFDSVLDHQYRINIPKIILYGDWTADQENKNQSVLQADLNHAKLKKVHDNMQIVARNLGGNIKISTGKLVSDKEILEKIGVKTIDYQSYIKNKWDFSHEQSAQRQL